MTDRVQRILEAIAALSEEERTVLLERLAREALLPTSTQTGLPLRFTADGLEGPADYTIVFDGGSQGNPGPGYGSYALMRGSEGKPSVTRLDFGREMTNNEAEYEAVIAALQGLIERVQTAEGVLADSTVEVRGDSALVIHQVEGKWRTKDDRMRLLRNRVRDLLRRFGGHRLVLQGREESVLVLGH